MNGTSRKTPAGGTAKVLKKGVLILLMFIPTLGQSEPYYHEIEMSSESWFNATFNEKSNVKLMFGLTYRYRLFRNFSAGIHAALATFHSSAQDASLSVLLLAMGPALRIKFTEESSPFLDFKLFFGNVVATASVEGLSLSESMFAIGVSLTGGYIYNILNVDIAFGLSYGLISTDKAGTGHTLGIAPSITFLF